MTDVVTISPGHDNVPIESSRTFQYSGHIEGWVVPNTMELLTDINSSLAAGPLNQFDETSSGTSYDVTIDTGEAIIGGAGIARDTTTTITLSANTTGQTVYVGWSYNSKDTVVIGLSGAFVADDPKIPIWTYGTDGSGVTSTTEERTLGETINVKNERYESGGAGSVDNAENLGGNPPSSYLRSDENDAATAILGSEVAAGFVGAQGQGSNEYWRVAGPSSDFVYQVQGGAGRITQAWNAYYDTSTDTWKSIIGSEPHALLSFNPYDPGPGDASVGGMLLAAAPSNANAGDAVNWRTMSFDENGDLNLNGAQMNGMRIENRSTRPTGASNGRLIYRTDKD